MEHPVTCLAASLGLFYEVLPMTHSKTKLRQQLRAARRALSSEQQVQAAKAAAGHVLTLPGFSQGKRIGLYLAADGELDPEPLLQACTNAGKSCYLPVIGENNSMVFALYEVGARLQANQFGILEPLDCAPRIAVPELDWVFLPLVGFNPDGTRLGMGGGYYDRAFSFLLEHDNGRELLEKSKPILVGLAHSIQQLGQLIPEPWDIPLAAIVTESGVVGNISV